MSLRKQILKAAASQITQERENVYGSPVVNLDERTAELWNAYFNIKPDPVITGVDVCNLMILLKMARLFHTVHHYDSWLDIIGYAAAGWEIVNDGGHSPFVQGVRVVPRSTSFDSESEE